MSAPDRPRRPVSERKLAANRANAKKSTGPRTPEGKARTGRNGLKHGLRATPFVLLAAASDEERALFSRLLADLQEQYRPESAVERLLVERIGLAHLRLLRACRAERGAMAAAYRRAEPDGLAALPLHLPDLLQADLAAERSLHRSLRALHRERLERRREAAPQATEQATEQPTGVPHNPPEQATAGPANPPPAAPAGPDSELAEAR